MSSLFVSKCGTSGIDGFYINSNDDEYYNNANSKFYVKRLYNPCRWEISFVDNIFPFYQHVCDPFTTIEECNGKWVCVQGSPQLPFIIIYSSNVLYPNLWSKNSKKSQNPNKRKQIQLNDNNMPSKKKRKIQKNSNQKLNSSFALLTIGNRKRTQKCVELENVPRCNKKRKLNLNNKRKLNILKLPFAP